MLEGGDPNSMLEKKVLWVVAASQQTFYCLWLPTYPMLGGGDPNALLGVKNIPGVDAVSQQTLFIVSGSQSIQC